MSSSRRDASRARLGLLTLFLVVAGCSDLASTRDLRATLLDEDGNPLPGALLYAEISDENGPFAFVVEIAGQAGEVPDSAREAYKLPWRPGARVTLVGFAPGRRPEVLTSSTDRPLQTDGVLLVLATAVDPWNPDLARLSYPFSDTPGLAARAARVEHRSLSDAFLTAWEAREAQSAPLTESEVQRIQALRGR